MTLHYVENLNYTLWCAPVLDDLAWVPVADAVVDTDALTHIALTDPDATSAAYFYRALAATP